MITFVTVFLMTAVCQPNFMSQLFRKALCLPSATVVAERLCFHRCLSVHGGRCTPPGRHPPPHSRQTPPGQTPPADTPPPQTPPRQTLRQADTPPWADTPRQTPPLGRHLPGRHTPASDIWWPSLEPPADPPRWILQRTVDILLECILV